MSEKNLTQTEDGTALELIIRLRSLGISLSKEADQLRFKAPKGLLNEHDIAGLKQFKADILALLQAESEPVTVVSDPASRYAPFPLTDVQAAYLLGRSSAFEYGGVASHIYLEIAYPALDPHRVKAIWNQLIQRHDMLRATISQDGQQQVHQQVPSIELNYVDAASFDEPTLATHLEHTRSEMAHRVYDTEQWPLFGLSLTQTPEHFVLHFSIEFLIADWSSVWSLLVEFEDRYFDSERKYPELALTFRDYVITEKKMKNSTAYYKDKQYWLDRIDQLPSAPELPLIANKHSQDAPRFRRYLLELEEPAWNQFKAHAQKQGVTPTSAVMAVYSAVLERWSKNKSFCLNLTVLNRQAIHDQVHEIVGDFTTVNMLEVNWSHDKPFYQQAKQLNTQLFSDLEHRLFTGVEVLREITRRKGRDAALMPVVFTSAIGLLHSGYSYKLKGAIQSESISQAPQVFIDCQASDTEKGIRINWDVRDGIFPEKMIDDMFLAFETLLHTLALNEEAWHNKIDLSLPEQQQAERQSVNATATAMPSGLLHSEVINTIQQQGDKTAIFAHGAAISYQTLGEKASAVARKLKQLGCNPQERVAIVLEKGADQVAAVLGCLGAEAVYVPIDVTQPEMRRNAILEQANIRFILSHSQSQMQVSELIEIIHVDTLAANSMTDLIASGDPELPAYIIFTSGSTGTPKGVVISHKSALNTIIDINRRYNVTENDSVLALAQLGFDLSVYDIFGLLSVGGTLVFPDAERATDPSHWAQLIERYQVTLWNSVPPLMQMLASYLNSEKTLALSTLRTAFLSGDWIPLNLPDEMMRHLPSLQVVSLGGATEASIWSIYHDYQALQPDWNSIPYGRPLANQGFRILDSAMRDCPVWVAGELYITGEGLAMGYFGNPAQTEKSFFAHPDDQQRLYRTGDLGRYHPGGEIEFLGREDNQVKIRGHRIELGEIEAVIQKHPGVANAGVVVEGSGDDRGLLAIVEMAQKNDKTTYQQRFDELVQHIKQRLAQPNANLNQAIETIIEHAAGEASDEGSKILEINAKAGEITASLENALNNQMVDYLVTDHLQQNLSQIHSGLSNQASLNLACFDLNQDYRNQGLAPNAYDVIIVSNLSEQTDVQHAVKQLMELVSAQGYLIFIGGQQNLAANQDWFQTLEARFKNQPAQLFTQEKEGLTQTLFLTKVKNNQVKLNSKTLADFIAQHLPMYMVPTHLQIVDALPLTANGKVDRKTLVNWRLPPLQKFNPNGHSANEMDPLEQALAKLWTAALGIPEISPYQNVYDLGTDSLVMAQVAGKIRTLLASSALASSGFEAVDISFDNLLRHMLNYPTINGLAKYIRSEKDKQAVSAASETAIETNTLTSSQTNGVFTNYGGGEHGTLRVVFHAGLGTLNSYMQLLDYLDKQQQGPVIGVSIKNIDTYCDLDPAQAVETIAEDYAEQLAAYGKQEVQLIGHCLGGFTAIEVSRRLLERGIEVRDLSLVDSIPPMRVDDDWILEIIFVFAAGISMAQCGFGDITASDVQHALNTIIAENDQQIPNGSAFSVGGNEKLDKVRRMFQKLNSVSFRDRFTVYAGAMHNVHGQNTPVEMLEGLFKAYKQSFKAAQMIPDPYIGDVRFLLAEVTFSFLPVVHEETLQFWDDVTFGELQVTEITGDHNTCVENEPHVSRLAKLIEQPLLNEA